ncbi:metalloendoproteinase 1-like [Humulus lupulus]|uniref:metalloendoproteinase 1-like n=1 Tax=Humulus lupulus TaxID=3486 RepID=UPI002B415717|nr:metalloendoproteinase 1-like [Humulus lupulus]
MASPFSFLKDVEGAKKGDKVHVIGDVKHYLQRFGYLEHHQHQQNHNHNHNHHRHRHRDHIHSHQDHDHHHNNHFDDALESAIRTYQINYKLEPTGILDQKTIFKMMQPRCAMPDITSSNNKTRMLEGMKWAQAHEYGPLYTFFPGAPRWPPSKFTLSFGFPDGTTSLAQNAIRRAFSIWSYNTHFRFIQAPFEVADIKVSFHSGDHGDGVPFDGPGGTLGHSFQPTTGVLHLDADENWVVGEAPYSFDLVSSALHEIGHTLGLMHSSDTDAIMYPILPMGETKGLNWNDVQGIRVLYNDLL